jgi:hypothetical protein
MREASLARSGPSMPKRKEPCAAKVCKRRYAPNAKGCGGKQKVQAPWLTVDAAMTLLKDDATDESWICMEHRDRLRELVGTGGVDARIKVLLCIDYA